MGPDKPSGPFPFRGQCLYTGSGLVVCPHNNDVAAEARQQLAPAFGDEHIIDDARADALFADENRNWQAFLGSIF